MSFLSRELITEMRGHAVAREEADRRVQLLTAVVGGGPRMSVLDREGVLAAGISRGRLLAVSGGQDRWSR